MDLTKKGIQVFNLMRMKAFELDKQDCMSGKIRYFLALIHPFTQITYGKNLSLQSNLHLADQLDGCFGRVFIWV